VRSSCDATQTGAGRKGKVCFVEEDGYALNGDTANDSYVEQSMQVNVAAGDHVLLEGERVYEGMCPREIYCSRIEGLCEEVTAVLEDVNVEKRESDLLHHTPIQTSEPDPPVSRLLKKAELSALLGTNDNIVQCYGPRPLLTTSCTVLHH
jgi:hypothetical protein